MSELTGRLPQNAVLKFRDENVEPNVRSAAERALATLVSHSTTAIARRRAAEAELTKLTDAIEAPLAKLIHNDPESVRAIEVLRKRHLVEPLQTSKLTRNAMRVRRSDDLTSTRSLPGGITTLNLQPPFDWTWWWWQGHEPLGIIAILTVISE